MGHLENKSFMATGEGMRERHAILSLLFNITIVKFLYFKCTVYFLIGFSRFVGGQYHYF